MSVVPSRRERLRASTLAEIKALAREQVSEAGPQAVSLRAIARAMGMSTPGLYRYFASREDLLDALIADVYTELVAHLEGARDARPGATPGQRLMSTSRAFRQWAASHHADFGLAFTAPVPRTPGAEGSASAAGLRFAGTFFALMVDVWEQAPFPVSAPEDLDPALVRQLTAFSERLGDALPLGALQLFLSCWVRLYGLVSMEVFGHLDFALTDAGSLFEAEVRDAAARLGFADDYETP